MSLSDTGVRARSIVQGRASDLGVRIRRMSAGPVLVRVGAMVSTLAALVLAAPLDLLSIEVAPSVVLRIGLLVIVAALVVGLFPRTRVVSLVALLALGGWLVSTVVLGDPVDPVRVGLLATALYLMHATSALAAVLPYDCVVAPIVLLRWLARVGGVLGVGLVVGLGGMLVAGQLPSARTVVGPIVGSAVAAGLAGLLAWHLRRR